MFYDISLLCFKYQSYNFKMYFQTSCFHSNGHNETYIYNYKYIIKHIYCQLREREYSFMIACLIA